MNCDNCTSKQNNGCAGEHCGSCCGGSCSGTIYLTEAELKLLEELAICPFMAVARSIYDGKITLCDLRDTDSAVVSSLETKRLITVDATKPIDGYNYSDFSYGYLCGSIALTKRGQDALDEIDIQGVGD